MYPDTSQSETGLLAHSVITQFLQVLFWGGYIRRKLFSDVYGIRLASIIPGERVRL